ncbi:MAG: polysaccharide pyruvyl transferase family protein [Archaeoglobaceae archaeon]
MSKNKKFGLLVPLTENLGDYIQSLAAKQFLPRVDFILDRDNIKIPKDIQIKAIINGWLTYKPMNWALPKNLEPLFISIHISPKISKQFLNNRTIEYLKDFEIGCRDLWTTALLKKYGLEAYFSGCLTLTLDYKFRSESNHERKGILIIDIPSDIVSYLPEEVLMEAEFLSHYLFPPPSEKFRNSLIKKIFKIVPSSIKLQAAYLLLKNESKKISPTEKLLKAEEIIYKISKAKLVITSRLHAALPALSFNTPVLFVNQNPNDPRFKGYLEFLNYYSIDKFKENIENINYEKVKNPNQEKLQPIKKNLVKKVKEFVEC